MEMIMSSDSRRKKAAAAAEANAMIGAGKTARPCDGCLRKRARWYCPADDAFLCQPCDSSVHAANQLAGRHDRLRLLPTPTTPPASPAPPLPSWHAGFSRKSRTPRREQNKNTMTSHHRHRIVADVVPDILTTNYNNNNNYIINGDESLLGDGGREENGADQEDSHRVPVLDPSAFDQTEDDEEEKYFLPHPNQASG